MAAKDGELDFEARLNLLRARMPMTAMQTLETAIDSLKKVRMLSCILLVSFHLAVSPPLSVRKGRG